MRKLALVLLMVILTLSFASRVWATPKIRLVLVNPGTQEVSVKITVTTTEEDEYINTIVVYLNDSPVRTYVYQRASKPITEEYVIGLVNGLTKVTVKVYSTKYGWVEAAPLYIDSKGETSPPEPQSSRDAAVILGVFLIGSGIYWYIKRRY